MKTTSPLHFIACMAERVVDGTWDIRSLGFGLEFVSRPHLKGRIALAAPTWKLFPM
jgi:hypothetical protein